MFSLITLFKKTGRDKKQKKKKERKKEREGKTSLLSAKERIFSTDNLHLKMIIDGRSFSGCLFLHCMQGESLKIHAGVFVSSKFRRRKMLQTNRSVE